MAGLKSISSKKKKKPRYVSRARFGLANIPMDKGFDAAAYYFHNEVDRKEVSNILKNFVKANYSKSDVKAILANPEYKFTIFTHYACAALWKSTEQTMCDKSTAYVEGLKKYCSELLESGKILLKDKISDEKEKSNVVILSPQQRLERKIQRTIMVDLDNLEDAWINSEKADIDVYTLFRKHGLSGSATLPVKKTVEGWLLDYEDAYHKRCEQAVEGYSHVKRPELNRRIKVCQTILSDLERIKDAAKATKTIRIKKPVSIDKQVARVNYKKEDNTFKIVSITPVQIIGKKRLYTFNTKSKLLTEYVTEDPRGFQISGSTIKNIDSDKSRNVRLRKPEEFIPVALKKTPKQVDVAWSELTTKTNKPNGRLNADTILLRVSER